MSGTHENYSEQLNRGESSKDIFISEEEHAKQEIFTQNYFRKE